VKIENIIGGALIIFFLDLVFTVWLIERYKSNIKKAYSWKGSKKMNIWYVFWYCSIFSNIIVYVALSLIFLALEFNKIDPFIIALVLALIASLALGNITKEKELKLIHDEKHMQIELSQENELEEGDKKDINNE
jgi:hypothetical protein